MLCWVYLKDCSMMSNEPARSVIHLFHFHVVALFSCYVQGMSDSHLLPYPFSGSSKKLIFLQLSGKLVLYWYKICWHARVYQTTLHPFFFLLLNSPNLDWPTGFGFMAKRAQSLWQCLGFIGVLSWKVENAPGCFTKLLMIRNSAAWEVSTTFAENFEICLFYITTANIC